MKITKKLHLNCVKSNLTPAQVERLAKPLGGFSSKGWSKLISSNFDENKDGNIGIEKLAILAQIMNKSPCDLISDPKEKADLTIEQVEYSLNKAFTILLEVDVFDEKTYFKMNDIIQLIAAAQHTALCNDTTQGNEGIMAKIIKILTRQSSKRN
jgi:hypothetical protein